MRQSDLDNWFMYHAPDETQIQSYAVLRSQAKQLAETFDRLVPDCADKTAAIRDLRGTVMAMNLAIACYQPPTAQEQIAALLK